MHSNTPLLTESHLLSLLEGVKDPEIPVISIVDLGIIKSVRIAENQQVEIDMTPTFAGCPALDVMKSDIKTVLSEHGIENVTVHVLFNEPWTSNLISEKGRKALKDFGLSPPPEFEGMLELEVLNNAVCPLCGSNDTFMMSPFGPTACRAIHHCNNCKETFEQFKPL